MARGASCCCTEIKAAVLEQARQGRVRSIVTRFRTPAPAVARRVVPELLGAGCSLLELDLSRLGLHGMNELNGTWARFFGEAAVCSAVLRKLGMSYNKLSGPLPELRLPALQELDLSINQWTGGLEPLQGCTALKKLVLLGPSLLTGGLEPLKGCAALQTLYLAENHLTGNLEPLRGCTALQKVYLGNNHLTGDLESLQGCTLLMHLSLLGNKNLVPTDEDKAHFEKQGAVILT